MGRSQNTGRRSHGKGREWLSRNREPLARDLLARILFAAFVLVIGILLGAGTLVLGAGLIALVAFAAGALLGRGSAAARQLASAEESERLTAYIEAFSPAFYRLEVGEFENGEAELLTRPARLIDELTGVRVQLAVLPPAESKDDEAHWRVPYVAGISPSEWKEFEVPLKDSYLAQMQRRWDPRDKVTTYDLQEPRWRKAGADFDAFAQAGFRMLRCFPFGPRGSGETPRPCIVLLSKEPSALSGVDDFFLMLLGALLSHHALLAELARLLSEGG